MIKIHLGFCPICQQVSECPIQEMMLVAGCSFRPLSSDYLHISIFLLAEKDGSCLTAHTGHISGWVAFVQRPFAYKK